MWLLPVLFAVVSSCTCNFQSTDLSLFAEDQNITNYGSSIVYGGVGIWTSHGVVVSIIGFPPGITLPIPQDFHIADNYTLIALQDAINYLTYMVQPIYTTISGNPYYLGGKTFTPGNYRFSGDVINNGTFTLDPAGQYNVGWVFIAGFGSKSLTTLPNSQMIMLSSGNMCNVSWFFSNGVSIGQNSTVIGDILLGGPSAIFGNGSALYGRLLTTGSGPYFTLNSTLIAPACGPNVTVCDSNQCNSTFITISNCVTNTTNCTQSCQSYVNNIPAGNAFINATSISTTTCSTQITLVYNAVTFALIAAGGFAAEVFAFFLLVMFMVACGVFSRSSTPTGQKSK